MNSLHPFQKKSTSVQVQGDLQKMGSELHLTFKIKDLEKVLWLPDTASFQIQSAPREDGLWNTTCFEMFLKPEGLEKYYEFNFSLKPAWNVYVFESYRTPQPPLQTNDFQLKSFAFDGSSIQVKLASLVPLENVSVSLTCVIKEKNESKHYLALAHAGEKADFHLASSFVLKR